MSSEAVKKKPPCAAPGGDELGDHACHDDGQDSPDEALFFLPVDDANSSPVFIRAWPNERQVKPYAGLCTFCFCVVPQLAGAPNWSEGDDLAKAGCASHVAMMRVTVGMSATSILKTRITTTMLAKQMSAIVIWSPWQ